MGKEERLLSCPPCLRAHCSLFSSPPVAQAGGVAGASVDLILFPLDTIKTRLQSPQGFSKAGGFRGIYAGVPSTAVGSFPNGKGVDIHTAQKPREWIYFRNSFKMLPTENSLCVTADLLDLYFVL